MVTLTDIVNIPTLLDFPDKLLKIIVSLEEFLYFLLEGGRGSAKTQTVARFILYIGDKYKLRIVCGREIQNSIEESVYTVLKEIIEQYGLNYDVGAKEMEHRTTKTKIIFKGFREQGKINIKGLEDVDILWIDEAQAITKETLKVIIPTIRKDRSRVFFTMNRTLKDDAVFDEFSTRSDCLHIHIDYFENKHCTEKLKLEAEKCRLRNFEDYEHIWLGKPLDQASRAVFRNIKDVLFPYTGPEDPISGMTYKVGGDLARSVDHTVLIVFCEELKRAVAVYHLESENKTSWNYQKELIHKVCKKYNNAEYVGDSTGVGDPITEDLQRMGVKIWYDQKASGEQVAGLKFTNISKDNIVERLKVCIELKMIQIPTHSILVKELEDFEATILPSRKYRYAAPEGKDEFGNPTHHDDCVFALALALWGVRATIYEQWQKPEDQPVPTSIWARVKKDLAKQKNQENSLHDDNLDASIVHEGENNDDPFGE